MTKHEMNLRSALLTTGLVQPVESKSKGGYLEVLCRQIPGQEKPWLRIVEDLLKTCDDLDTHVCRRYLMKNGSMVFGWHIAISVKKASELGAAMERISTVLASAAPVLNPTYAVTPAVPQVQQHRRPLAPGQHPQQQNAPPRPPGEPGMYQEPPPGFVPQMTVIRRGKDQKGEVLIREMPLPHIYHDLNEPNAKGKGAKRLMGD